MDPVARFRCGVAGVLLLVVALVLITPSPPAMAQDYIRVDGTVLWISGPTLTLALDGQATPSYYQIIGQYLVVVQGQRPTVNVDLRDVPQTEYSFMRSGERVGVIGTVSSDQRRLLGRSIIRDAGQQAP